MNLKELNMNNIYRHVIINLQKDVSIVKMKFIKFNTKNMRKCVILKWKIAIYVEKLSLNMGINNINYKFVIQNPIL